MAAFLKEADPALTRVGVLFNPATCRARPLLSRADRAGRVRFGVAVARRRSPIRRDRRDNRGIFREPRGGLILPPDSFTVTHRLAIVAAAARHRVPAIYSLGVFFDAGGFIAYGAGLEVRDAEYIDLILRGARPGELPVQSPRKFELLINLKAAQALGLKLPLTLLARADRIIE